MITSGFESLKTPGPTFRLALLGGQADMLVKLYALALFALTLLAITIRSTHYINCTESLLHRVEHDMMNDSTTWKQEEVYKN